MADGNRNKIPFLVPNLVKRESYASYLDRIDHSRIYSNFGPLNSCLENRILDEYFHGSGAVTTVNNATTGLMLAIAQLKKQGGKYAIMPSFTFSATPLAAMWCGLQPYFVDIRPDHWCMDEQLLDHVIDTLGDEAAVVVPYAAFGFDLDLTYYSKLHQSKCTVVIDAAASFGTSGDAGHFGIDFPGCCVFSFHATKSFGVGEGGLIYSGNVELIQKIRQASNFGYAGSRESTVMGLNGKISEYTAAVALATLDAFPAKRNRRQEILGWYDMLFEEMRLPQHGWMMQKGQDKKVLSVLCPIGISNEDVIDKLKSLGIHTGKYFSPSCHEQELFADYPHTGLPVTNEICSRVITLPLWEEMEFADVRRVVEGLASV